MEPIRIIQFNNTLSKTSGVMSVIMNYYKKIDRNQIQFDFLYFLNSDDSYLEEIKEMGGRVYQISKPKFSKKFKNETSEFLKELNEDNLYQTVHIHTPYLAFILKKLFLKANFKNIIGHSHATTYSDHFTGKVRNLIIKKLFMKNSFTHKMTCSLAAGQFLYNKNKDVYLLNNAIEPKDFLYDEKLRNEYRKQLNIDGFIVLGNVGRLEKQKNQLFLLKSFKKINDLKPNTYKLVIIGSGSLEGQLKAYIDSNHLNEDVLLLGFRNDVSKLLNAFDVFLLPSLFEGLPVVAVEAQANSLPILLSNKITKEIGLNKYHFLSICSENDWVKTILALNDFNRVDSSKVISSNNYDINSEAKKLLVYYQKLEGDKT